MVGVSVCDDDDGPVYVIVMHVFVSWMIFVIVYDYDDVWCCLCHERSVVKCLTCIVVLVLLELISV